MKTAFRKRSPQWKFLKTLFWRVRVDRRKRNFSKTLRSHYQFQSTTRNIRNLFNMAGRALPFPVVYTWAYFKPNCLFLSRFSFVNSSSWLIQEAAEHYQVTFATGVKRHTHTWRILITTVWHSRGVKWVIVLNMALSYHSEHVCVKHAQSGKLSFSNRFSVLVWTGENDAKMLRVDANVFGNGEKKLR